MPRGGSKGSGKSSGGMFSRGAPTTTAAPRASTTTAPAPASRPAPASSAPNPAFSRPNTPAAAPAAAGKPGQAPKAAPGAVPQQQQQQPGGMGFLGTVASTAVGSMVGNVVANSLFGGHRGDAPQDQPGAAPMAAAGGAAAQDPYFAEFGQCAPNFRSFMQCADTNGQNLAACQWNFNVFQDCRRQFPVQQIAASNSGVGGSDRPKRRFSHSSTATTSSDLLSSPAKSSESLLLPGPHRPASPATSVPTISLSTLSRGGGSPSFSPASPPLASSDHIEHSSKTSSPNTSATNISPPLSAIQSNSDRIVRLNIGGHLFQTTKTTLLSRGNNFFVPLVNGEFTPIKDETGAIFIDRNGAYFAPILDYLRHGTVIVPPGLKLEGIVEEASFYSIDLSPGMCGEIKEGLYTSSSWILFIERDSDHPWIWGITGVEERSKQAFFQEVCTVKDGVIYWRDNNIYAENGKVYIWNKNVFKSKTQLFYRCAKSEKFPLNLSDVLESDRSLENEPVSLNFIHGAQGLVVRSHHPTKFIPNLSRVLVLCKSLIVMQLERDKDRPDSKESNWLLYLHSDLAFFIFNHPNLDFGESFHLQRTLHSSAAIPSRDIV